MMKRKYGSWMMLAAIGFAAVVAPSVQAQSEKKATGIKTKVIRLDKQDVTAGIEVGNTVVRFEGKPTKPKIHLIVDGDMDAHEIQALIAQALAKAKKGKATKNEKHVIVFQEGKVVKSVGGKVVKILNNLDVNDKKTVVRGHRNQGAKLDFTFDHKFKVKKDHDQNADVKRIHLKADRIKGVEIQEAGNVKLIKGDTLIFHSDQVKAKGNVALEVKGLPAGKVKMSKPGEFKFEIAPSGRYVIGVVTESLSDQSKNLLKLGKKDGLVVVDVLKDSPAMIAGMKKFDVIHEINNTKVGDVAELLMAVDATDGKTAMIQITRNTKPHQLNVVPGKRLRLSAGTIGVDEFAKRKDLENRLSFRNVELSRGLVVRSSDNDLKALRSDVANLQKHVSKLTDRVERLLKKLED